MNSTENIRNFCIIAHVDHGKSTLADRFLEVTGTIEKRDMKEQLLDTMELERERGITIKLQPVRMLWHPRGKMQNETQKNAELDAEKQNNPPKNDDFLYADLTYMIRGAVFDVRKKLGSGHKEQVYHNALEIEFKKRGLTFESKKNISIIYEGKSIGTYQPDFIVNDKILIELKSLPEIGRPQTEQLWSYLKGCDFKLALLINFGSKDLEIKRVIYDKARLTDLPRPSAFDLRVPSGASSDLPRPSAFSQRVSAGVSNQVENNKYILNLIDTPGHVDFSYEVSRSLAAVEGAILLVDASQGIEAQTLSNIYMALEHDLEIIPVVNKIDLPQADPERVSREMVEILGIKKEEILFVSGKTGEGVEEVLKKVIEKVPAPRKSEKDYPRALIFDSFFDPYKGVITYIRVFDGEFKKGDAIEMMITGKKAEVLEIGYMKPKLTPTDKLDTGEIGYIVTGLKDVADARVGDTITSRQPLAASRQKEPLPGYKKVTPFVFAGLFTTSNDDYPRLKEALEKLSLSDSSLSYDPESSQALGFGYRCGFLGLLHLEIIKERLEREFDLDLIVTSPSVTYEIVLNNDEVKIIHNPSELPEMGSIKEIREPWLKIEVVTPSEYVGGIMKLSQDKRGIQKGMQYIDENRVVLTYEIPMASIITDFYDDLKSISSGYASLNYEILDFRPEDLEKLDILIAGDKVDSLSQIVHKTESYKAGLRVVEKLKDNIPKQMFKITLQAAVGAKILAREDISAMRKDVTAKLYGGDVTRKNKLLDKQKKGKKKMKMIGSVEIPTKVFLELLRK